LLLFSPILSSLRSTSFSHGYSKTNASHITKTQDLLRHVSAVGNFGVSDDRDVYGAASYHCTSAHGPFCQKYGAVGEHPRDFGDDADEDDLHSKRTGDGSFIVRLGADVDVQAVLKMFQNGDFEDLVSAARNGQTFDKNNDGGVKKAKADETANERTMNGDATSGSSSSLDSDLSSITGRALHPDQNPARDFGIKSFPSKDTRRVEFLNARSASSAIFWVDFGGAVSISHLPHTASLIAHTRLTLSFLSLGNPLRGSAAWHHHADELVCDARLGREGHGEQHTGGDVRGGEENG
jgi:hypothetical protein